MREFRRASEEFRSTLETNLRMNEPDPVTSPHEPNVAEPPPTPVQTAAGPVPDSVPNPYVDGAGASAEPFLARQESRLFHIRECSWAVRINEPERVYFKRVAGAREKGFLPCPVRDPREPTVNL